MDDKFICPECFQPFEALFTFHRHVREVHSDAHKKRPVIDRTCNGSEVPEVRTSSILQNAELS